MPEDDRESRVTLIAAIIILAKCAMGSPAGERHAALDGAIEPPSEGVPAAVRPDDA